MKRKFGTIVATRRLSLIGTKGKIVIVKIGKPRKLGGEEWACPFFIDGLGVQKIVYGHGFDAIQALVMALEGIRTVLEKTGKRLSWADGEAGLTGFSRFVPIFYGLKFMKRVDRLIDREVRSFARAAERKHRREHRTKAEE